MVKQAALKRERSDKVVPEAGDALRREMHAKKAEELTPLELDRFIHERLRLGIVSALAVNESLSFNDLKKLLKTTSTLR